MDYTIFDNTDSAEGQLDSGIGASDLTIPLKAGEGDANFPEAINGAATSLGSSILLNATGIGATGLAAGDFIENLTDGSVAFVLSVATNSVTTTPLRSGSDNIWQSSDEYAANRFIATINKRDINGVITQSEKILIKARASGSDNLTVQTGGRGYDGSSAQAFAADDYVSLFVVSAMPDNFRKALADAFDNISEKADSSYVAAALTSRNWKQSVRVATTANVTLASDLENGDTLDGIALVTGDRILVKDQSTGSENGIYTVNASGAPTRATDFDDDAEVTSAMVAVEEGTSNADSVWLCTDDAPTIGVDNINFTQFGASVIIASQAEAIAGSSNTKIMTPLRVSEATMPILTAGENFVQGEIGYLESNGEAYKSVRNIQDFVQLGAIAIANIDRICAIRLEDDKLLMLHDASGGTDTLVYVASVDRTTITDGTPATLSAAPNSARAALIDTNKVALTYASVVGANTIAFAVIATISGTTVTLGTPVQLFASLASGAPEICKLDTDKFLVTAVDTVTDDPVAMACTVSGTTITAGAEKQIEAVTSADQYCLCVQVQTDVAMVAYQDGTNISVMILEISGTTITLNTAKDLYASGDVTPHFSALELIDSDVVIFAKDTGDGMVRISQIRISEDEGFSIAPRWNAAEDFYLPIGEANAGTVAICIESGLIAMFDSYSSTSPYPAQFKQYELLNADAKLLYSKRALGGLSITTAMSGTAIVKAKEFSNKFVVFLRDPDAAHALKYAVFMDTSNEYCGVAKDAITAAATGFFRQNGEVTTSGLVGGGRPLFVGDGGAYANSGTKRIGVSKSDTVAILS